MFLQKTKNTTANRTSNQRRTEMGKTRQDENAKTRKRQKMLSLCGFLVFSFSGFLLSVAASCWPGRVFYVLRGVTLVIFEKPHNRHKEVTHNGFETQSSF